MRKRALPVIGWIVLWIAWVWLSRFNHPSIRIDAAATAIMLCGSAAMFYGTRFLWRAKASVWTRIAIAAFASAVLTAFVVASIQILYDFQVGPNPLRFSVATNLALDWLFIILNAALATIARFLVFRCGKWKRRQLKPVPSGNQKNTQIRRRRPKIPVSHRDYRANVNIFVSEAGED